MVWIRPIRLAIEEAAMLPMLLTNAVVEMIEPSFPVGRANFWYMKRVMREFGTMPLARESMEKRAQSLRRVRREFGESVEIVFFFFSVFG